MRTYFCCYLNADDGNNYDSDHDDDNDDGYHGHDHDYRYGDDRSDDDKYDH
jgi:hypothetical protein